MSTRANIVLKDNWKHDLWFYRHCDGYPSGTLPTLKKFIQWVNEGKIRDNAEQAGGWLILIGAEEYGYKSKFKDGEREDIPKETLTEPTNDWKCGAYEPATGEHGDIEYLYTIDLEAKTLKINNGRTMPFEKVLGLTEKQIKRMES